MNALQQNAHWADRTDSSTTPASGSAYARSQIICVIVNNFNGWNGDTLFELDNGQVWQQSGPGVETHVAARPRAIIFRSNGLTKLYVEGVASTVQVKRLQ